MLSFWLDSNSKIIIEGDLKYPILCDDCPCCTIDLTQVVFTTPYTAYSYYPEEPNIKSFPIYSGCVFQVYMEDSSFDLFFSYTDGAWLIQIFGYIGYDGFYNDFIAGSEPCISPDTYVLVNKSGLDVGNISVTII
jgi:hypothetical protein